MDELTRFTIESAAVRGAVVDLHRSWLTVLQKQAYPPVARDALGEALAAVALMSTTIKFDGSITMQAMGDGPLHTLVAQATHKHQIRGLARYRDDLPNAGLAVLFGSGKLVLTVDTAGAKRYQGIVPLQQADLSGALAEYFKQSEQLPTRFWFAVDSGGVRGLLLQALPSTSPESENWARISMLADTLTKDELRALDVENLLYRLFNEERVRMYDEQSVTFACSCSRERTGALLRGLGFDETKSILVEQGMVGVDCEFCNQRYRFDAVDVEQLFAAAQQIDAPDLAQ